MRRDIERYRKVYLMHDDEKFRAAVAALIAELEQRLRALTGDGR